ncbi:ras and ef-hand domain-containing protein [Anaeramoeba ignava]|uniref:Ras and ef-hand domain-containing protein n=1 Tax=Anaeramoeba ignava TaxID=1746090 RepID=A0A9Q0LDB2_ANAIG|nr:ras and ef-hand domain-containing protein [Anaeramoeba ignava]
MAEDEEKTLKILIIGNSLVGKSSILLRYCDNQFTEEMGTTIGVDFRFATLKINDEEVKLQIWDTAGQERFRTITGTYYRNADGIMIVYDITKKDSFSQVKHWFQEIKTNAPENVVNLLVGNKADLENQRDVTEESGKKLAKHFKCSFFEVSAKTGNNVSEAFHLLAEQTLAANGNFSTKKKSPTVNFAKKKNKKSCC